jgi:hypothetical protein
VAGSLALVGGDGQGGTVGAALGSPLVVNVKSTTGAAMSGQAVTWSVVSGGGSVSQGTTNSGADGNASVTWTLGGTVGAQAVTATAASFSVTFTATAAPGPVAKVVVTPSTGTLDAIDDTVQLAASIQDQFGNAAQGTVVWSSSDPAVLTVDAQGVAKAVANGTAEAIATAGTLTGKAELTVAQKVSAVVVTPANTTAVKGGTTQLAATAKDGNGFDLAAAAFVWTTSDAAVATVDSTGLVTAVEEGSVGISAAAGGVADTATVTVTPAAFKPTGDTEVSGTLDVAEVEIPEGVTVTLKGDAVIKAVGNVSIAGALVGDCRTASLTAGGDLTVTGSIDNVCSDSTAAGAPLSLTAGGAINLSGVSLTSDGGITVGNAPTGALSSAGPLRAPGAADGLPTCTLENTTLWISSVRRGTTPTDPPPVGAPGVAGGSIVFACAGDLIVAGGFWRAGAGAYGGQAVSEVSGVIALGGDGGAGGDVRLVAGGRVIFRYGREATAVRMEPGDGGEGGRAWAINDEPTAIGGDGGRGGLVFVVAGGGTVIDVQGALEIRLPRAGPGAFGSAKASNGADATTSTPAKTGGDSNALGGAGGGIGLDGADTNLIGTLFQGGVSNAGFMTVFAERALAGSGGDGVSTSGNGGDGGRDFPDGAGGGDAAAAGGRGGDATLLDNRTGLFLGKGGPAGGVHFGFDSGNPPRYGSGGAGWMGCRVGMAGPGTGGAAGDVVIDNVSGVGASTNSFKPGADGAGCTSIMEPSVVVTSDANGHAPFIGLSPSQLTVTLGTGNTITISGNGNWVTVTGAVDASGNFTANGTGTVAGFPGVPVSFTGTLDLDPDGRTAGIQSGTLTLDSTNSNLPANGGGQRNPAVYSVTATKIG